MDRVPGAVRAGVYPGEPLAGRHLAVLVRVMDQHAVVDVVEHRVDRQYSARVEYPLNQLHGLRRLVRPHIGPQRYRWRVIIYYHRSVLSHGQPTRIPRDRSWTTGGLASPLSFVNRVAGPGRYASLMDYRSRTRPDDSAWAGRTPNTTGRGLPAS